MTLPTTAEAIHDRLLADAVISAGLGTYALPTGGVIPAIGCFFEHETLPPGTLVNGIEIAITRMPGYSNQPAYDGTMLNPAFRIYVSGYHAAATLRAMAERVMALLPGSTSAALAADPPGEGIGVIAQVVVTWSNPTVYLEHG